MMDEFEADNVAFVGEQDGPSERRLKEALLPPLRRDLRLARAYLARIVLNGSPTVSVALALFREGEDSSQLVSEVGKVFESIFNAQAQLDLVFLSPAQDKAIGRVCGAFYHR